MITLTSKSELRKKAIEIRNSMANTNALKSVSLNIISKILNSGDFKKAKNIALYLPIRNEIDLTSLLNVKDKNFYLPRCNGDDLEFCLFEGENSLTQGRFNILEPTGKKIDPTILDIIYIPALMANKKCYRLGYGKGFYDRFFAFNEIKAKKVIVVAFNLISNEFVQDDLDFQCDEIISEK